MRKIKRAVGAERLEGRDLVALAVEEGADRLSGADAADRQRRQADQRQEHRHLLDEAPDAGRGIAAVADVPAAVGKCRRRVRLERRRSIASGGSTT